MIAAELLFLILTTIYCIRCKRIHIISLLFLLLPVHGTIKYVIFNDSDIFFSFWKEIAILIYFIRVNKSSKNAVSQSYCLLVGVSIFFALIGYFNGYKIAADLKNLLFPPLLILAMKNETFEYKDIKNMFYCLIIGTTAINITGIIDFFNPVFRLFCRTMMSIEYTLGSEGQFYYENTSFKIMGIDRAAGLMAGGPNQLGIFNSFVCLFCYLCNSVLNLKIRKEIFYIFLGISLFALTLSFSRAGLAIIVITLFLFFYFTKKITAKTIASAFIFFLILLPIAFLIPQVQIVFVSTFTGEEASSAERGNMVMDSLEIWMSQPWGLGLGASDVFFAESALINLGIELGLLGIPIYLLFYYDLARKLRRWKNKNPIKTFGYAFIIAYLITSFVSVNTFENPFIYFAAILIGLSLSTIMEIKKKNNIMKISIIIATYNAGQVLKRCLDSIVPQLNSSTELIIIDGNSKDNTMKIVKEYGSLIAYAVSEPDKGVYDAWNKGIKVAKGEWIMFIGADDMLLPDALKEYITLLDSEDYSDFDYICAQNEYTNTKEEVIKKIGRPAIWKEMRFRMSAAHVGSLHNKKNLFDAIGYYNYEKFRICSDYDLLLRKRNLKTYFLHKTIARMQTGGMSFSIKAIKETYNIRRHNKSIGYILNNLCFARDLILYYRFKFRYKV